MISKYEQEFLLSNIEDKQLTDEQLSICPVCGKHLMVGIVYAKADLLRLQERFKMCTCGHTLQRMFKMEVVH